MANISVKDFTSGIISSIVCIIMVVSVCIPIISANKLTETGDGAVENAAAINSMIAIIPLLLVVGVIIAVVGIAIKKN